MYLQCFGRPLGWRMWVFTYSSLLLLSLLISFHQLVRGVLGLMESTGVLRERLNCPYLTRQEMAKPAIRIVARSFAVTNRGWYVPRVEHNCDHARKFIFSQIFSPWLIGLGSAPAAEDDEDRSIPSGTRAGPLILVPKFLSIAYNYKTILVPKNHRYVTKHLAGPTVAIKYLMLNKKEASVKRVLASNPRIIDHHCTCWCHARVRLSTSELLHFTLGNSTAPRCHIYLEPTFDLCFVSNSNPPFRFPVVRPSHPTTQTTSPLPFAKSTRTRCQDMRTIPRVVPFRIKEIPQGLAWNLIRTPVPGHRLSR